MRRVRATFLLRCVILAVSVGLVIGIFMLGLSTGWTLSSLVFLVVFWLVGIDLNLLPLAIEHFAVRRAARSGREVSSLWFVDVEAGRKRNFARFHKETEDNPTIR